VWRHRRRATCRPPSAAIRCRERMSTRIDGRDALGVALRRQRTRGRQTDGPGRRRNRQGLRHRMDHSHVPQGQGPDGQVLAHMHEALVQSHLRTWRLGCRHERHSPPSRGVYVVGHSTALVRHGLFRHALQHRRRRDLPAWRRGRGRPGPLRRGRHLERQGGPLASTCPARQPCSARSATLWPRTGTPSTSWGGATGGLSGTDQQIVVFMY
jgi:hypothetical protein